MRYQNAIHSEMSVDTGFKALGQRIGVALADREEPQAGIHKPSWDLLTDHGFWHVGCPRNEHDSQSWARLTDPVEELAAGCGDLGFVLSAVAHAGIIRMVQIFGTNTQKERFLPRLLQGEIAAMAITEPTGGSDVPRLKLTAHPSADGLSLNGQKAHITNAPDAKIVLVVARRAD